MANPAIRNTLPGVKTLTIDEALQTLQDPNKPGKAFLQIQGVDSGSSAGVQNLKTFLEDIAKKDHEKLFECHSNALSLFHSFDSAVAFCLAKSGNAQSVCMHNAQSQLFEGLKDYMPETGGSVDAATISAWDLAAANPNAGEGLSRMQLGVLKLLTAELSDK